MKEGRYPIVSNRVFLLRKDALLMKLGVKHTIILSKLHFFGVGGQHQNDIMEQHICDLSTEAYASLLHTIYYWPDGPAKIYHCSLQYHPFRYGAYMLEDRLHSNNKFLIGNHDELTCSFSTPLMPFPLLTALRLAKCPQISQGSITQADT